MPHFGLLDESMHTPEEAELIRSRLHLRSARRRFRQGRITTGISVLFDSFISALRYYIASPRRLAGLRLNPGEDLNDERVIYEALVRSGVLVGDFDYDAFDRLTQDAVDKKLCNFDFTVTLKEVESVLTKLGVMPFDEDALPPEKPDTP